MVLGVRKDCEFQHGVKEHQVRPPAAHVQARVAAGWNGPTLDLLRGRSDAVQDPPGFEFYYQKTIDTN